MWIFKSWLFKLCDLICKQDSVQFSSFQSLSHVRLFVTPWTAARQASLSITTPRGYSNSCPLSRWCHPAISSSVVPFSCLQSLKRLKRKSKRRNHYKDLWNYEEMINRFKIHATWKTQNWRPAPCLYSPSFPQRRCEIDVLFSSLK